MHLLTNWDVTIANEDLVNLFLGMFYLQQSIKNYKNIDIVFIWEIKIGY